MRLIDADRLLNERMKSKYYHLPNGDIAIPIIDIERAPTIEPKQGKWIPCSERLPNLADGRAVLVNVVHPDKIYPIIICGVEHVERYSNDGYINAWMPLPEPYVI